MQISMLLVCLLIAVLTVFVWLWLYNRKKYHNLKHQIPANVVKNYLDSIIQNSTALKSSLFRGGGLDVDTSAVPAVLPLADLPGGSQVGFDSNDVASLKAQISNLEALLQEKSGVISQLENENASVKGEVRIKDETIEELERIIESLRNNSSETSPEPSADTSLLETEIDSLKEQLKEYEIISADIANMKKLSEENALLKESLREYENKEAPSEEEALEDTVDTPEFEEALDEIEENNSTSEEPEAPAASDDDETDEVEDQSKEEDKVEETVAEETSDESETEKDEDEENEKSPEDLLSEFEKMLG